jgi:hypothetical protein
VTSLLQSKTTSQIALDKGEAREYRQIHGRIRPAIFHSNTLLGRYASMKIILAILISGLLLCGCAQRQATSAHRAIDSIEAGKDVVWSDGMVLHVAKRDGDSVEGIRIVRKMSDGNEMITTADTGTLSIGSVENPADIHFVRITLRNAQSQNETSRMTAETMMLVLER